MANTRVEVFELNKILESSLFDGFDFADNARSFLGNELPDYDFEHENAAKLSWQPVSLAKIWKPQKVVGTVRPFNDYPCIGLGRDVPIFSKRAVNVLRDFLEANGELLPLITKQGEYFAYNLLTKSDALDVSRSSVEFVPESAKETAFGIDYFEFHRTKLTKHAIFRLREYPTAIYVTSGFKDRVEQAALTGFHFVKVWPYPPGGG